MKQTIKKALHPVFTPFAHVPLTHKTVIGLFWMICLLIVWNQAPTILPQPMAIGMALVDFFSDTEFYLDIMASLFLTIKAMGISIITASVLSWLYTIGMMKPVVLMLIKFRYMSLMGFFFAFMILFHSGETVKTILLTYSIVPFFALSIVSVITRIQQKEYDLWTTLRYSKWEQVKEIIIIGKMDYLFEAVRTNFAIGWLMITMVESFSMAEGGLGVLLFKYNKYNQLDKIFALQIVIFCIGMLFDFLLQQARYLTFPHVSLAENK